MTDLECNDCGKDLRWGEEYPVEDPEDDYDAICGECRHERITGDDDAR